MRGHSEQASIYKPRRPQETPTLQPPWPSSLPSTVQASSLRRLLQQPELSNTSGFQAETGLGAYEYWGDARQ